MKIETYKKAHSIVSKMGEYHLALERITDLDTSFDLFVEYPKEVREKIIEVATPILKKKIQDLEDRLEKL